MRTYSIILFYLINILKYDIRIKSSEIEILIYMKVYIGAEEYSKIIIII